MPTNLPNVPTTPFEEKYIVVFCIAFVVAWVWSLYEIWDMVYHWGKEDIE